jgi:hypothetical protein
MANGNDVLVHYDGGTVALVQPLTERARTWIDENVSEESQWLGNNLAVEHRYISGLLDGMYRDGLTVAVG